MSRECEFCGKKPTIGNNVSHSKRRTKRRWLPNLQRLRLQIGDVLKRTRICTGCLKTHTRKSRV